MLGNDLDPPRKHACCGVLRGIARKPGKHAVLLTWNARPAATKHGTSHVDSQIASADTQGNQSVTDLLPNRFIDFAAIGALIARSRAYAHA